MTKEEIIDNIARLNSETWRDREEVRTEIGKLLSELKNALEQPTSDDCVSRQAVLDLAVNYGTNSATFLIPVCSVKKLPHVTPTQRWISVSERLPKEDGEYLLFGKIDEDEENYIFIGEYDSCGEQFGIWQEQFDRTTLGCLGSEFFEYSSVIAWQPLPKPYEEKKGNKNND